MVQVVEKAPDLSRLSPEEVKRYVDNQMRRQTRTITFLTRLIDRLMIFLYISIIYRHPVLYIRGATTVSKLGGGPTFPSPPLSFRPFLPSRGHSRWNFFLTFGCP